MNNEILSNAETGEILADVLEDIERLVTVLNNTAYDIGFGKGVKSVEKQHKHSISIEGEANERALARSLALDVFLEKTQWVQDTAQSHELGMHRADVLRQRIEALEKKTQRAWVGLTDDDIVSVAIESQSAEPNKNNGYILPFSFARAIEGKLKKKNT